MWPKSRGVLSPDPTAIMRAQAYVFGGINFGDLVKNSPIRQIKIPAKVSGYTVYSFNFPGEHLPRLTCCCMLIPLVTWPLCASWQEGRIWGQDYCTTRLRNLHLTYLFRGKQGYDTIDCDHMEIDLVISQIQDFNIAACTSSTWPQFRDEHQSQVNQNDWIVQNPDVVSPFVSSGNAVCRYE